MYKYTYLLSQSYRSEAGIARAGEVAGAGERKELRNVEVGYKIMPRSVAERKEEYGGVTVDRNAQYKTVEKQYGKVANNKEPSIRENAVFDIRNDKSLMVRGNSQMKVKSIAEKYSHQPTFAKNNDKTNNSKPLQVNPQNAQENKAYREYKELKIAGKEDRAIMQYQSNIDHMQKAKQLDYSPINQIKMERQPLQQANGKLTQDQEVNRTRVRLQISSHLQKQKPESHNYPLPSKKYTYITEKQTKPTPVPPMRQEAVPPNQAASNQTVAKLSSLQQRIKTTIGSYLPA